MADIRICSIDGCEKKHVANGFCRMHYTRNSRYGDPTIRKKNPPYTAVKFIDEIASKFNSDECLYWPYSKSRGIQPQVTYAGKKRLACRVVCEIVNGEAPSKFHHAAHSCGKGDLGCVNPRHLRWATPKENNSDKIMHGTHIYGEKSSQSKLKDEDVRFIFSMKGKMRVIDLARKFGVSSPHICHLQSGRFWRHITSGMLEDSDK